jgi:hypothetical protein
MPAAGQVFSERLLALMEDIVQGRGPNAGRFCGHCYHPLPPERDRCPHCERSTAERAATARIPDVVVDMYRARRSRAAWAVWSFAWGGLLVGITVALLPLIFVGATWWAVVSFFALFAFFYLLSANLANSVGDALGYHWGESLVRKRWHRFLAQRDRG